MGIIAPLTQALAAANSNAIVARDVNSTSNTFPPSPAITETHSQSSYQILTTKSIFASLGISIAFILLLWGSFLSFQYIRRRRRTPVQQYRRKFDNLVMEIGQVLELAKDPEVQKDYGGEFTPKEHIVYFVRHIEKMDENGRFPGPEEFEDGWTIPKSMDFVGERKVAHCPAFF
ncbi:hypothetical protein B0J14DRAFT_151697 [Halenospora varia]|nr:hypothetical protein B0J14DRAFT_151697 [Halenospora varia]